jgi:hypothetical protein
MKQFTFLMLTALLFAACSKDDDYTLDYFTQTYSASSSDSNTGATSDTLKVNIVYNGSSATVTGDVSTLTVSQQGADVTMTSTSDKYLLLTLSGQSTDGSLIVYSQKKYGICLNGLELTNPDGPAINNQCSKELIVDLLPATDNVLTDGTSYTEQTFDQKGTLFSEGQIYFRGTGCLTVNGNARNGIASDDYIVVEDGTLNVNVASTGTNGVKANDGFTILGGALTINVKGNGARGIRCEARTTISGGTTNITTSGKCTIETVDGVKDTTSCAGIKSDSLFTMTAGTLIIKSTGDGGKGINCSENVEFKGGTLNITTTGSNDVGKPKGIKSDTGIIVSGGSFTVKVSKSWALDNGIETEDPTARLTVEGSPTTKTLQKRSVIVVY